MKYASLPAAGGNAAERLLRNRGRARAFFAAYARARLLETYDLLLAGRWKPPLPRCVTRATVSLTSWAPRFNELPLVLLSLTQQTARPSEIVLWLTESDKALLDPRVEKLFRPYGVVIRECDNLRSHKKWLPMIESGHDEPFVICDDDIVYPRDWLARLLAEGRQDAFVGLRAHKIRFDARGKVGPYGGWDKQIAAHSKPSPLIFVTGGGGAIIIPNRIRGRFLDRGEILSKCPAADDIWLNMMHIASGFPPYKTKYSFPCLELPGSSACGLAIANIEGGDNDRQMARVSHIFEGAYDDLNH